MARLFTREEAEELLPELREVLEALRQAVSELDAPAEYDPTPLAGRRNGRRPTEPGARKRAAEEEARRLIERVAELGVELKDPRSGLVDFPSRREGQVVYLCWRLGEPHVDFWHPLETGFAGRQPL